MKKNQIIFLSISIFLFIFNFIIFLSNNKLKKNKKKLVNIISKLLSYLLKNENSYYLENLIEDIMKFKNIYKFELFYNNKIYEKEKKINLTNKKILIYDNDIKYNKKNIGLLRISFID